MNQLEELYNYLTLQPIFEKENICFFYHHNVIVCEVEKKEICRLRYNFLNEQYEFLSLIVSNERLMCAKEPVYILDIEKKILEKKKRISS